MAGNQNAGSIYYDVELEAAQLLTGASKVDTELEGIASSAKSTGKSVDMLGRNASSIGKAMLSLGANASVAEGSVSRLKEVAKNLALAISVEKIAEYANAWVTVSNKPINSVRSTEDLATVTQRVFDISQDTRSGLEATATLYGWLERATRSAGTSTADLSRLVETVSLPK